MEIEGLNLTDEEKEILKRKVSLKMESINAVVQDIQIMEYIGKHKKLDSDAEFGIVPITEFISSHPEFFKRTDIDLVQRENNLDGVYVAQFVGGYILMNEGHVIGNARELSGEDGKKSLDFSFSKIGFKFINFQFSKAKFLFNQGAIFFAIIQSCSVF